MAGVSDHAEIAAGMRPADDRFLRVRIGMRPIELAPDRMDGNGYRGQRAHELVGQDELRRVKGVASVRPSQKFQVSGP